MSDSITVSRPIEIKDNSVERVALELMEKIAYAESKTGDENYRKPNPREYYLKLYNQCHRVASWSGVDVKDIL
ncbi:MULTISPECIES: hypothetical protein [Acinetobacter]|uniref:hypothetical protein n=1 Tax=Acinetobacter TaxID=469 RepID=UPI0002AE8978|nr:MULTISPECIES: hypothetical protein [Acinetobacter]ELW77310.1 hypothetical protein ACINWC743_2812 [Acinetobacter sp. WC-743]MCU4599108.1 hypothetical protein [Acinetobacter bereziniae]